MGLKESDFQGELLCFSMAAACNTCNMQVRMNVGSDYFFLIWVMLHFRVG